MMRPSFPGAFVVEVTATTLLIQIILPSAPPVICKARIVEVDRLSFRCLVLERAKQRTGNGTGTGDKGAENADDRGHIRERAAYDVHHKLADLGEHTVESGGVDAGVHHNLYHGYAGDQGDGQIGHLQTGILGDLPGCASAAGGSTGR